MRFNDFNFTRPICSVWFASGVYTGLCRCWWFDRQVFVGAPTHHHWFITYNLILACAILTYIPKYLLTTPTFTYPLGSHVFKEILFLARLSCRAPSTIKECLLQCDIEQPIALKDPVPSFLYAGWTRNFSCFCCSIQRSHCISLVLDPSHVDQAQKQNIPARPICFVLQWLRSFGWDV